MALLVHRVFQVQLEILEYLVAMASLVDQATMVFQATMHNIVHVHHDWDKDVIISNSVLTRSFNSEYNRRVVIV